MEVIELFSESYFENAKYNQKLPLECNHCHCQFLRIKKLVKFNRTRKEKQGYFGGLFCGRKCRAAYDSQSKKVDLICTQCNLPFSRKFSQTKSKKRKSENFFCSQSCAGKYNNAHKKTGTRVSKLEVWLHSQLKAMFPNIVFSFNKTDAINAELDVYIRSLNLAFEINGIFHYKPIFGKDKFERISSKDANKIKSCHDNGIDLCIIDVSSFKYFKEQKAKTYLDIISNIISDRVQAFGQTNDLPVSN